MHEGYGSCSVYLSVCLLPRQLLHVYLVYTSKTRCCRVLYGVFKVFTFWLSLKALTVCSFKVLVSFTGHHCLHRSLMSSRRAKETASRRVCTVSDSSCNTTDSSLIIAHWQITFLACCCVSADLAHVVLLLIT